MKEDDMVAQNRVSWEARAYEGRCASYGPPHEEAEVLRRDPEHKLRRLLPHLGEIRGRRIGNPLGSHGRVAVAFALLGARVTVFDLSAENRRYAIELAAAADVAIDYVVGHFLDVAVEVYSASFDAMVMELGILHYFSDLRAFVELSRCAAALHLGQLLG